jgi:nucleotide-binding universal stress UspA family protein
MLRSVLVPVDGSPVNDAATSLALDWAERFDARLLALGVVDEASAHRPEPVPLGAGAFKKMRDETRLAEAHHHVGSVLAAFRERAAEAGVEVEALEETGDPAERIIWEAQRCDAVILGRETHFDLEAHEHRDATLGRVLRASSRPVVVVPPVPRRGDGVLVAYGGGREAARTLQLFAMLGLAGNATLDILTVHRDHAQARIIARAAGDFLGARGIRHRAHAVASAAMPSEVLLEEVASRRPALLVMGAHGRHPLRDLFATSVTRAVLEGCPVPVFVGA